MNNLQSIRKQFIDFFISKNHQVLSSYPLIPENDPTLLFINAGMAPLKNFFLGLDTPPNINLVTCQKCLRVGGKHNDLDQIGYTKRHHTFFEMLGNFSFGGYFKKEAIDYAWEFITEILKLPKDKLYVTVHPSDTQAYEYWCQHLATERITKLEANFWFMGDQGPCGPCTEIFYDLGNHLEGCQPGLGDEGDRFLEIWNVVFMTYSQDENGTLTELKTPCIDTGAGLERLAAVLNNTDDTFNITDFTQLTNFITEKTNKSIEPAHKVLADHARAVAFLLADGINAGAEGRSYILRKIIRRAARFAYKLGNAYLLEDLLLLVIDSMKDTYPELEKARVFALQCVKEENERFVTVLEKGMLKVEAELKTLSNRTFSGKFAFELYDTYGFPLELLTDIAREQNLLVDIDQFNILITEQKTRSKNARKGGLDLKNVINTNALPATNFLGYDQHVCAASVLEVFENDQEYCLALNETVFYGESGGQLADKGVITNDNFCFEIEDVIIMPNRTFLHKGKIMHGTVKKGDIVQCVIDIKYRNNIRKYHTGTHLLHAALRKVIGDHIIQKGSLVACDRLRFDFAHNKACTQEQLQQVEDMINDWIAIDMKVNMKLEDAKVAMEQGAMALFGEKYPEKVRVITVQDEYDQCVSMELCGGTHVKSTGLIGRFHIVKESSCAAGVRRIEAVCGLDLYDYIKPDLDLLNTVCAQFKCEPNHLLSKLSNLSVPNKENAEIKLETLGQGCYIYTSLEAKDLAGFSKDYMKKHASQKAVLVFALESKGYMSFVINVSNNLFHASDFVKEHAQGGGNALLAQGKIESSKVDLLLQAFKTKIELR